MEYVKLTNVTADIAAGDLTRVAVLLSMAAGELKVVNLKGRMLSVAEFTRHLDGTVDGEDLQAFTGVDADR